MRARRLNVLIAAFTVAVILIAFVFVGCQPTPSSKDAEGIVTLLRDFVAAVNNKDAAGVAATLYPHDSNEYNAFIEKYPATTYFNEFTYPDYQLISLRTFTEVGSSAVYSKWAVTMQARYTVKTSTGSEVTATDNFDNSFHFVKKDDTWYFTTAPSPYEGNLPGEGFTIETEQLPDYTVTFDSNGGSEVEPINLKQGDALEIPEAPSREGFRFGGWYTGNDFITVWRDTMKVEKSFTLFARWLKSDGSPDTSLLLGQPDDKVYDYTAENLYSVKVTVSNSMTAFNAAERFSCREGAVFGAFYDIQGTERMTEELPLEVGDNRFYIIITSENGEYTSVYQITVSRLTTRTVSFADGDTGLTLLPSISVDHGRLVDLSDIQPPRKAGYSFNGWLLNKTQFQYDVTPISTDIVLTADWKPLATIVQLNHSQSVLPEGAEETVDVYYGQSFRFPVPARNGYRFEGWIVNNTVMTDSDGYSLANWSYPNNDGLPYTATASWIPIVYNIYYGGLMDGVNSASNPNTYMISSEITLRPATRAGYNFVGWSRSAVEYIEIKTITPGSYGNLNIYAVWDAIDYNVQFFDEDGTTTLAEPQNVSSTQRITRPENPSKDGKTFVGWYTDLNFTIRWDFRNRPRGASEDFNLYARFTDEYTAGLEFSINGLGTAYSISEYTGSATAPVIPSEYLGLPVVAIEGYAFIGTNVQEIVLPDSIKRIAIGAFSNCANLEIFRTSATDIAEGALSGTSALRELSVGNYLGELGEVFGTASYPNSYEAGFTDENGKIISSVWQIPNSLETIIYTDVNEWRLTPYAFANFVSLKNAEITVTFNEDFRIGHHAFYGCSEIQEVIISGNTDKVTSIGYYTFSGCDNLATFGTAASAKNVITFPENLKEIGNYAFAEVRRNIVVNDTLEQIDKYALSKYAGERVTVSHSISIIEYSFIDATRLKYFGNENIDFIDLSNVTYLGVEAFVGCSSITKVALPLSDEEIRIRKKVFSGCTALEEIIFAPQIVEIGSDAFSRCTSLTSISLPSSMSLIEASAFYGCVNLETVTATSSLTVRYHAFARTNVTEIAGTHTLDANWKG